MYLRIFLLVTMAAMLGCCTWRPDGRLERVSAIVADTPRAAIDSLAAIDRAALGEADRYFYDFLAVKAADKAYITHTTDSLILGVVDYAERHQGQGYYPEALYYAGRVYSDLGDYPTALSYFHQALDLLPPDTDNQELRGNVVSQTGRLLGSLRMYNESFPYLEEVIEIERRDKDTLNLVYDLQLLGHTYLNVKDTKNAKKCFEEALQCSENLHPAHMAKSKMYLAETKYMQGDIDSALILIRGVKDQVDSITHNSALIVGSRIYLSAGILDTAFIYANEIINSNDPTHSEIAYNNVLSKQLRRFLNPDSVDNYLSNYVDLLEGFYNENQNRLAVHQQSMYNYSLHDAARQKAEKSERKLQYLLLGALFVMFAVVVLALYLRVANKNKKLKLNSALETIEDLRLKLERRAKDDGLPSDISDADYLRRRLIVKILNLDESSLSKIPASSDIIESDVYARLQEHINLKKMLPTDSDIWDEIDRVVQESSPGFKANLQLLSHNTLSTSDYRMLLLIKCGIQPTNISILFGRERGTINSRRQSISIKLFDQNISIGRINCIVRYL